MLPGINTRANKANDTKTTTELPTFELKEEKIPKNT